MTSRVRSRDDRGSYSAGRSRSSVVINSNCLTSSGAYWKNVAAQKRVAGTTATAPVIALSIARIIELAIALSLPATAMTGGAGKRLRGVNARTTGGGEKTNATTGGVSANSRFKTSVVRTTGGFISGTWSG